MDKTTKLTVRHFRLASFSAYQQRPSRRPLSTKWQQFKFYVYLEVPTGRNVLFAHQISTLSSCLSSILKTDRPSQMSSSTNLWPGKLDKRALSHEPADAQPLPGKRRFLRKLARPIEKDNIVAQCDEHEPHGDA